MFDHEKLDVYRVSIEFTTWVQHQVDSLTGTTRFARDQLIRAAQSIPLNIAEGNGKRSGNDRKRFWEIARGSALECAALMDVLNASPVITNTRMDEGKALLVRIVSMLTKMTEPDNSIHEAGFNYQTIYSSGE